MCLQGVKRRHHFGLSCGYSLHIALVVAHSCKTNCNRLIAVCIVSCCCLQSGISLSFHAGMGGCFNFNSLLLASLLVEICVCLKEAPVFEISLLMLVAYSLMLGLVLPAALIHRSLSHVCRGIEDSSAQLFSPCDAWTKFGVGIVLGLATCPVPLPRLCLICNCTILALCLSLLEDHCFCFPLHLFWL